MSLINSDLGANGCFRAYLIHKPFEKTRVYEPGIQPNPLNPDGSLDESKYNKNINIYPEALWMSRVLRDAVTETVQPCWCTYEIGDNKRPIILGFMGKGIPAGNQWVGHGYGAGAGGNGTSGSFSGDGGFTIASGNGVINISGTINDSRNSKYSDISQVPQVITREYSVSRCLSEVTKYANQSANSNSIAPVAKAIVNGGGASSKYIDGLGTECVVFGNAVLCATTPKFGKDGDYIWAHFTDGAEVLFLKFDEKSTSRVYGPADPANEWGHWVDYENGFGNATSISILEICGMAPDGINKTCDYMVNLGVNVKNDAAFAKKSMTELKQLVQERITVNSNQGSNITIDGNNKLYNGLIRCINGTDAGYDGDEGLDVSAPMGTPVYAPCNGTMRYSEYGHTPWGRSKFGSRRDDTPYSIGIDMANPVQYGGKNISYIFLTHLSKLVYNVPSGSGGKAIKAGEIIAYSGTANDSPHLHIGLSPSSWSPLPMSQVRSFFNSRSGEKWEVGK